MYNADLSLIISDGIQIRFKCKSSTPTNFN